MAWAERDKALPCPQRGELVESLCWCGRESVKVSIEDVGRGITGSCSERCHQGVAFEPRPEDPRRHNRGGRRKAVA